MPKYLFVLALIVAGCTSDSNPTTDMRPGTGGGGGDGGGGAQNDLATLPTPDMAVQLSCSEVLQCLGGCGADSACAQGCFGQAKPASGQKFQTMVGCLFNLCSSAPDGGTPKCSGPQDGSQTCQQCLNQELNMPTVCKNEVNACLSD